MISDAMTEVLRLVHIQAQPRLAGCAEVLGVDGLAVSLVVDGQITEQLWSSGKTAALFEDLQFTLGEGPGPDALRDHALRMVDDIATVPSGRWPALLPALGDLPVAAVFCFPLHLGGIFVGVLTLLRAEPGPMSGQQMDDALALAEALTLQFLGGEGVQLESWGDARPTELHRAVVHQATGMISVQLGLALGPALLRLRAYSFSQGLPITDIARDIVARRLRLPPTAGDPGPTDPTDEMRG
ncbi:ANTAR domain-containing protein [Streptomyces sp. AcH 505]|uniref:GAF domain-containing protein n=2 Tax=unclassified Streptomyces TaxID=2593676 RepID=UPI00069411E5